MAEWRVVQLSDCHVAADPGERYRGHDARASLVAMLEAAMAWRPDLLLLTGDLAEDGSEAAYAWLAGAFRGTGVPLAVLPGNHDSPGPLARAFEAPGWPAVVEGDAWRIVLLDSTVPGDPGGELGPERLAGLAARLEAAPDRPTLVALHHHPLPVQSPWIDRFPLREGAQGLRDIVGRFPALRAVTWGHIHHAFRRGVGDALWLGTPSTVANSLPFAPAFTPDPGGPAARWFRLFEDGRLATGILRSGG